jgi:hypothetical protein
VNQYFSEVKRASCINRQGFSADSSRLLLPDATLT